MRSDSVNVCPPRSCPSDLKNAVVGHPPRLYRSLMSGRSSASTQTGDEMAFDQVQNGRVTVRRPQHLGTAERP